MGVLLCLKKNYQLTISLLSYEVGLQCKFSELVIVGVCSQNKEKLHLCRKADLFSIDLCLV